MKITKVLENDNILALRVQDVNASYINTIRRYMQARVPTMAIEMVEFQTNNSILYDELIAHRLGLIALTTDAETYSLPEGEWTEPTGNPRVEVQLSLSVPPVKGDTVVTAGQLKSKDPKVVPVHPDTPIVKLIEGQSLELVATARMGVGEEHVKWSPGHVWYRHYPTISISRQPSDAQALAERFPKVFEVKGGKLALTADAPYHLGDIDLSAEGVEVAVQDGDYLLIIESWGQLAPMDIARHALDAYDGDLDEFSTLAGGLS